MPITRKTVGEVGNLVKTGLPPVQGLSSKWVHDSYGHCVHPPYRTTVYKNAIDWAPKITAQGATYIRGEYAESNASNQPMIDYCRANGLKWLMLLGNETQAVQVTTDHVVHIANNAADVCLGIEGINESNSTAGGTPLDWATVTVAHQQAIWNTAKSYPSLANAMIVGPSLHGNNAANSYTQQNPDGGPRHYHQLVDAGLMNYMDIAGIHQYPGGDVPLTLLVTRLALMRTAYGANYPVWLTETGYHNALAQTTGNKPTTEAVSATYAPRQHLQIAALGLRHARYEFMDDPNPGNEEPENNWGQWRAPSLDATTWTAKPEYQVMNDFLAALDDPGTDYTPAAVPMSISNPNITYVVTTKRNGVSTLWYWNDLSIWNPVTLTPLTVPEISGNLQTVSGTRAITAGGDVRSLIL
jgi:hypothetical protein